MKTRATIRVAAATAVAIALPLLAAERLAVKTGLWDNTVTMEMKGVAIPAAQLEAMPPAQRAQMEQMLKQIGVGAPRTTTESACLTDKDLDGNAFRDALEDPSQDCDYTEVTGTSRRQEWTFQCKTQGGNATGRMVVDVVSDTQVRGTLAVQLPQGGMDVKFDSKWKSATCPAEAAG
jgi:hypothetical protein